MGSLNDDVWLDNAAQWSKLARLVRRRGCCGLDTEFYNVDVKKQSCVGRARVHVWSLSVRSESRSPLGFHRAVGWVLPAEALFHPELKAMLEDASIKKYVHNQSVDDHSIHNHGVDLKGCLNTLNLARWVWPEYKTDGGFGLKNLMVKRLHREVVCEFTGLTGPGKKDGKYKLPKNGTPGLVDYQRTVRTVREKRVEVTDCSCGEAKCRKRKGHEKTKRVELVEVVKEKLIWDRYPLETIVPGHPRFPLLEEYAMVDAIAALELGELAEKEADPAPWPPWDGEKYPAPHRPAFAQSVEDEVVIMERNGFPVDRPFCRKQLEQIAIDEEAELAWLHRWYVRNAPVAGPHSRRVSDKIWTSPTRLVMMLDVLGMPRSPIWKKGMVKDGDVKTDEVAMTWLSKERPEMAKFVTHFLKLKRIRIGKKYHGQLAASSGVIHPICGPAGDSDDRVGAITGRLGIKGEYQAQAMPKEGERDAYQVRRAIVANLVPEVNAN